MSSPSCDVKDSQPVFAEGDRVVSLVLQPHGSLRPLKQGEEGIIVRTDDVSIRVRFAGELEVSLSPSNLVKETEARQARQVLQVIGADGAEGCDGMYTLKDEKINGQPAWENADSFRVLYSMKNGKWGITDPNKVHEGNRNYILSEHAHMKDALPTQSRWGKMRGGVFEHRVDVVVRLLAIDTQVQDIRADQNTQNLQIRKLQDDVKAIQENRDQASALADDKSDAPLEIASTSSCEYDRRCLGQAGACDVQPAIQGKKRAAGALQGPIHPPRRLVIPLPELVLHSRGRPRQGEVTKPGEQPAFLPVARPLQGAGPLRKRNISRSSATGSSCAMAFSSLGPQPKAAASDLFASGGTAEGAPLMSVLQTIKEVHSIDHRDDVHSKELPAVRANDGRTTYLCSPLEIEFDNDSASGADASETMYSSAKGTEASRWLAGALPPMVARRWCSEDQDFLGAEEAWPKSQATTSSFSSWSFGTTALAFQSPAAAVFPRRRPGPRAKAGKKSARLPSLTSPGFKYPPAIPQGNPSPRLVDFQYPRDVGQFFMKAS